MYRNEPATTLPHHVAATLQCLNARSNRLLHKRTKISCSYSWEGLTCKTRHQSLMGRNYVCPNWHKTLMLYEVAIGPAGSRAMVRVS